MKKLLVLLISTVFLVQCKKNDAVAEVEDIKKSVDLSIERFDEDFINVNEQKFSYLKTKYPKFLPENDGQGNTFTPEFWIAKSKDPLFIELNKEVQRKFNNLSKLENDIEMLISRVQHFFPDEKTPRVYTLVNEVTIDKKAFYTTAEIIVSLDAYLGAKHKFYQDFYEYQKENLVETQILPDLVTNFAYRKIVPSNDKSLLAEMIYFGKLHYLKDVLIPEVTDSQKIGYSEIKFKWCQENEAEIWSFFISQNLLFESNLKNNQRFTEDGPFTNFGKPEIDKESPGRVGQWVGWQIVRSFMENNNVSIEELMKTEPKTIFDNSKYKPKKSN